MGRRRLPAALLGLVLLASCAQQPPDLVTRAADPPLPQSRVSATPIRSVVLAPARLVPVDPPLFAPVPTQPPTTQPP
ncbi:MAG: hypothetical protein ACOH1Y_15330, partial [Propionicimonas sp.]